MSLVVCGWTIQILMECSRCIRYSEVPVDPLVCLRKSAYPDWALAMYSVFLSFLPKRAMISDYPIKRVPILISNSDFGFLAIILNNIPSLQQLGVFVLNHLPWTLAAFKRLLAPVLSEVQFVLWIDSLMGRYKMSELILCFQQLHDCRELLITWALLVLCSIWNLLWWYLHKHTRVTVG